MTAICCFLTGKEADYYTLLSEKKMFYLQLFLRNWRLALVSKSDQRLHKYASHKLVNYTGRL